MVKFAELQEDVSKEVIRLDAAGKIIFNYIEEDQCAELVKLLTKSKQGLEHRDYYSNTPLLWASHLGLTKIVMVLLKFGANYRRHNIYGQNALTLATYGGHIETCHHLVQFANYSTFARKGILTPLCVAVMIGNLELVTYYQHIEPRKSPQKLKCFGATVHNVCPLQLALNTDHENIIAALKYRHRLHV